MLTTGATAHEDYAFAVGLQALMYTFPLVEMVRMRSAVSPRRNTAGQFAGVDAVGPMRWSNIVTHSRKLLGAGESRVVLPNNDTLYTNVWFDLADGPQVLHAPDMHDRYYVFGLLDMYTNPFAHLGRRTTGTREALFLIAGPDWNGEVPAGMQLVRCPTAWVWMIGRTLIDGPEDAPAVHALQDQIWVKSLDAWRSGATWSGKLFDAWIDQDRRIDDLATHVRVANRALRQHPPPAAHQGLVASFAAVGVGPDQPEDLRDIGLAQRAGLERAYATMREIVAAPMGEARGSCWRLPFLIGADFGVDWVTRAAVAHKYIGALCSEEAIYPTAETDAGGEALSGAHRYQIRFAPGQTPPVDCFWSLSLYSAEDFKFTANEIDRFAIGDRTRGLTHDSDGGLTISIQNKRPAAGANWLPAPSERFILCLRAYQPRAALLDGSYRIPAVERVD